MAIPGPESHSDGLSPLPPSPSKRCTQCGLVQALGNFYANKQCAYGVDSRCKACHRAKAREYRQANPEKASAATKAWRDRNRDRVQAHRIRWKKDNPLSEKRYGIRSRFNITDDEYLRLFEAQDYRCGICSVAVEPYSRDAHVDHAHSCCPDKDRSCGSCVRGILCASCNLGIGKFRDDPELLIGAAAYLTGGSPTLRAA